MVTGRRLWPRILGCGMLSAQWFPDLVRRRQWNRSVLIHRRAPLVLTDYEFLRVVGLIPPPPRSELMRLLHI